MPGLNDLRIEILAGTGGAIGILVLDTFTGTDATNLTNHAPDTFPVGAAWGNQTASADFELIANKAKMNLGAGDFNTISIDSGRAEVIVTCDVTMGAAADTYSGLFVRSTASNSGIECYLSSLQDFVEITENNAGTRTSRAISGTFTVAPSTTYALKVVCQGQVVSVYVDGVFRIAWNAATFNQSATRAGLFQWDAINDSRWDNFKVELIQSGLIDIRDEFSRAEAIRFSTSYPGGLYLDASMEIARDIVSAWLVKGAQRIRILNGQNVVYEGLI